MHFDLVLSSIQQSSPIRSLLKEFGTQSMSYREPLSKLVLWRSSFDQTTGEGIRVAILDSGIRWQHPEFKDSDIKMRDFTASGHIADSTGHGTNMSALLVGASGIAPKATLLFGKVFRMGASHSCEKYITQGIRWAIQEKVDILTLPLGRLRSSVPIRDAIERAIASDIKVFAAAGNRGPDHVLFPANMSKVVAVTGVDQQGNIIDGCTQGHLVDQIALGYVPSQTCFDNQAPIIGSSPATVIAAGIATLALSLVKV